MSSWSSRLHLLWGAFVVLGCNDVKTVQPQTPAATPDAPHAIDPTESPVAETPMPADPAPQIHALGIEDAGFFDGSAAKAMAVARKDLRKSGVPALRIDAPFAVDTATHSSVPMRGVFARSGADEGDLEQSSVVIALDLTHGGFYAAPALRSPKLSGKGAGSKSGSKEGEAPAAFVASSFDLDVLERLPGLPRTGATHKFYVVQQGFLSNGAVCALSGDATSGTPSIPPELAATGQAHADSPDAPAGDGVRLSVATQAVSEPGASVMLRGVVRATGERARVFLVATSDEASGPFSFFVDVQLLDGVGHFNIDIIADEGPPKRPAQWHWYAFAGESSAGPANLLLNPGKPW